MRGKFATSNRQRTITISRSKGSRGRMLLFFALALRRNIAGGEIHSERLTQGIAISRLALLNLAPVCGKCSQNDLITEGAASDTFSPTEDERSGERSRCPPPNPESSTWTAIVQPGA